MIADAAAMPLESPGDGLLVDYRLSYPDTDDGALDAVEDLVAAFGTQVAAARAVGVNDAHISIARRKGRVSKSLRRALVERKILVVAPPSRVRFAVWLTPEERDRVVAAIEASGLSRREYLLRTVAASLYILDVDEIDA